MNGIQFVSSAMHINNPIDCRRLTLSLSFYQLDQERVMALSNQLMHRLYSITGTDFVYDCSYDLKRSNIKKLLGQLSEKFDPARGLSVGFDAYAVSTVVYNLTTLKKYRRYAFYENPAFLLGWATNPYVSVDYHSFFDQLFPSGRPDNAEIPGLVHKIFCEPDRMMIGYHNSADLTFSFTADCYQKQPERYYGNAKISFSAFCLGAGVDPMAEAFAQLALLLAESFGNICAHVSLQPETGSTNPYMRYFGSHIRHDDSHEEAGCSIKEWYPTYYLCGVEWMNILSPLTRRHIMPASQDHEQSCCVSIQELPHGGLTVKSLKPITQYGISDAYALKKILLPALYPGWSSVPLKGLFPRGDMWRVYEWCPRSDWAIVPIDEKEIEVVGTDLVFTSINAME